MKNSQNDEIVCIEISHLFPNISNEGKLISLDTITDKVYYYKNQILYQSAYRENIRSHDGQIKKSETKYSSFVYTIGNIHGWLFDPPANESNKKIAVDSFYKFNWLFKPYIEQILNESNTLLLSSKTNKVTGISEETYSFTDKKDTTKSGTVILCYSSKMNNYKYSFSDEIDSLKKMKLYKVTLIINSRFIKEYKMTLDKIETGFFMEESTVDNPKEIMSFFEMDRKNSLMSEN